jgi:hypothetical protein
MVPKKVWRSIYVKRSRFWISREDDGPGGRESSPQRPASVGVGQIGLGPLWGAEKRLVFLPHPLIFRDSGSHLRNVAKFLVEKLKCRSSCTDVLLEI